MFRALSAATALAFLATTVTGAADVKRFPPYPDVWGHEFPWGTEKRPAAGLGVFRLPDGDYLLMHMRGIGTRTVRHDGTRFFRPETRQFTSAEREHASRTLPPAGFPGGLTAMAPRSATLRDGSRIEFSHDLSLSSCSHFAGYVQRVDASDVVGIRKVLYYWTERPVLLGVNRWCERNVRIGRDEITTQVLPVVPRIERLEDDTVLVWDSVDGNAVIRLDATLGSKSPLVGRSIFLIDWDIVERLHNEPDDRGELPSEQGIANRLAAHIAQLRKRATIPPGDLKCDRARHAGALRFTTIACG